MLKRRLLNDVQHRASITAAAAADDAEAGVAALRLQGAEAERGQCSIAYHSLVV